MLEGPPIAGLSRKEFATAGGVALAVVLVGLLALAIARPSAESPTGLVSISQIQPGQCFASSEAPSTGVSIVGCQTPGAVEVLAQVALAELPWAGESAMQKTAANQCEIAAASNQRPDSTGNLITPAAEYRIPTQELWDAGARVITCTVAAAG